MADVLTLEEMQTALRNANNRLQVAYNLLARAKSLDDSIYRGSTPNQVLNNYLQDIQALMDEANDIVVDVAADLDTSMGLNYDDFAVMLTPNKEKLIEGYRFTVLDDTYIEVGVSESISTLISVSDVVEVRKAADRRLNRFWSVFSLPTSYTLRLTTGSSLSGRYGFEVGENIYESSVEIVLRKKA